jgi:hypothetical protein
MYGLLSIVVICGTLLWMFQHLPTSFRIIHENHQHEHLDPERFADHTETIDDDNDNKVEESHQDILDAALAKIQQSINVVNGVERGETNGK